MLWKDCQVNSAVLSHEKKFLLSCPRSIIFFLSVSFFKISNIPLLIPYLDQIGDDNTISYLIQTIELKFDRKSMLKQCIR